MNLTALLAVGLCIAAISEVTVAKVKGSVRACKPKGLRKKHPAHQKSPTEPGKVHHPRPPREPTCKGVECPRGEVCRIVRVQCFVAPCPPVATCVPKDESGEWFDSEEDWIDDPNGKPIVSPRVQHKNPKEDSGEPLPTPSRLIESDIRYDKEPKGGPNVPSNTGGSVPLNQAPIYMEGEWKGDPASVNPGGPLIPVDPHNPHSHKNPSASRIPNSGEISVGSGIPNSGEVPVGTRIPKDPNSNPRGHLIPEGSSNPFHGGKHGIPEGPHNPYHDVNPGGPLIPVSSTTPDHGGERDGVGIPEGPYNHVPGDNPEGPILRRGNKRDKLGWEASALHPDEIYGAGPSFRTWHPKIRACRTRKKKHRHHLRSK